MHDVIIIGGGASGLSAGLMLALACRKVLICDAGQPRNAAARVSHGLFTRDGASPGEILVAGREQLRAYPHVEFLDAVISEGRTDSGGVTFTTATGQTLKARKAILALGLTDQLPAIPGLAECWGKSIFPCPYCHAYEFRNQPLAFMSNGPGVSKTLGLLRSWSSEIALCTHGAIQMDVPEQLLLHRKKVPIYPQKIASFAHNDGVLDRIIFTDNSSLKRKAVIFNPMSKAPSDLPVQLGLIENGVFRVNPQNAQSAQPNIYVAGDLVGMFSPSILPAAAYSGAFTARHVNQALADDDFA